jgi:hypothetical protein
MCSTFPDPLFELCVQGEVVGDDGAMIRKLMDLVEFLVVDDDDMRWHWVHT